MDRKNLELALTRSIQKYLKGILPTGTKVVNVEDYPSLTEELRNVNLFVAYSLEDGALFPRIDRQVTFFVFVNKDPGSLVMNATLGILASNMRHGVNIPLYDGVELVTQLVVLGPLLRSISFEVDQFRSKSLEVTVKGVVT